MGQTLTDIKNRIMAEMLKNKNILFEIFLVSGDKNIIENKHWLDRIKIRQENK